MNSSIISGVFKIFAVLNEWYEYSFTHKMMTDLFSAFERSFIVGPVYRGFTKEGRRSYTEGSLIIGVPIRILSVIMVGLKYVFNGVSKFNEGGVNHILFKNLIKPLGELTTGLNLLFILLFGFFSVRTIMAFNIMDLSGLAVFLVLSMTKTDVLIKMVIGCFPSKIIMWILGR